MTDKIDTHDMRIQFGRHEGERYTRLPVSYLRWMVNDDVRDAHIARAELERRGIPLVDLPVEISGHAIDRASLWCRKIWHQNRKEDEGLNAWLIRITTEAMARTKPDDEGRIHYCGLRLIIEDGELYSTLKTVSRKENKSAIIPGPLYGKG